MFRTYSPRIALVVREGRLEGILYRATMISLTSTRSNLKVADLMEKPRITCSERDRPLDIVSKMISMDEWSIPLTGNGNTALGTVSLESFINLVYRKLGSNNLLSSILREHRVDEIMSTSVVSVHSSDTVAGVIRKLLKEKFAGIPVVDDKNRCVGIITHYDLLSKGYTRVALESESGPSREPKVVEVMSSPVDTVYPDSSIFEVFELMSKKGYGRIPVVDKNKALVGIVDRSDIAGFILKHI